MAFAGLGFGQGAYGQYATGGAAPAVETLVGCAVFGAGVTVTVARAIAFGVDGGTHVHATIGAVAIFGDLEVTGLVTAGSTAIAGDSISDGLDGLGT